MNNDKQLYSIWVHTKVGRYLIPHVDLGRNGPWLKPRPANPCLQIINEEGGLMSVPWSLVLSIDTIYQVAMDGTTNPSVDHHKVETIWRSDA